MWRARVLGSERRYWTRAIDPQSEFRALRWMHSSAAHTPGAAPPGPTMLFVCRVVCLVMVILVSVGRNIKPPDENLNGFFFTE